MKKHEDYLINLFTKTEILLGQDINKAVEDYFSISRDTAKKIIQRAVKKGVINSSSPLTFGKGQYAYLPPNCKLSKLVFYKITKPHRPSLYRLMKQIDENGGCISFYDALKITGTPLSKGTSKVKTLNDLIGELEQLDWVVKVKGYKEIEYIIDKERLDEKELLERDQYSNMVIDCALIPDIINFLKNQNIIDNKNIIFRNKNRPHIGATHNGFFWDIYAYTKTTGINTVLMSNSKSEDKSTLVVIDVMLSKIYSIANLQGFVDRVQIILNSTKHGIRKVLPILVYSEISFEALSKAKNLGYITLNICSVFGDRVVKILSELKAIKENEIHLSAESSECIDKIDLVMQSVVETGQETNLSNLIGDLFESLILHLLRDIYHSALITPNKTLPNELTISKGKGFEYDFIIDSSFEETIIIETKGFKSNNIIPLGAMDRKNSVKWFFNNTFVSAKKHLGKGREHSIKACYITTAKFDPDATLMLEELNKGKLKPSKIDLFYDGKKLMNLLDEQGNPNLKRILDKYYFK